MFDNFKGMNALMRKIAKSFTTVVQLTKKDDQYSLNTTILLFSTSQKFILGEGKDVTTLDKRKVKNVFTIEDNKLIEKQIGEDRTLTITREFFDEELIVTSTFGGVRELQESQFLSI